MGWAASGPQRRLLRRLPHPRPGQRPGPLAATRSTGCEELGARNLDEIEAAVARYGIDCDFERTGEIDVATEPHQAGELRDWHEELDRSGLADGVEFLDARRGARRRSTRRPSWRGLYDRRGVAMLAPGQAGLGPEAGLPAPRACASTSTRPRSTLKPYGAGMAVRTPYGQVRARQVALGTNIFPTLVKRVRAVHRARSTTTR